MQIICVSRGSYYQGKDLAEALATKLGYQCIGREDLLEEAINSGIAVGKLETAMLKPHGFTERLLIEKEYYQAFATAFLCEKALKSNIVYHGRTGHLLLPNVSHVLRLRVVEEVESRINAAMIKMNLPWDKAREYVEAVDEDVRRWVHTFYDVDWDATAPYDITVNLEQLSVTNAASALCSVAALPDFQTTPASRKAMEDLYLAARVRIALARNEKTYSSRFRVTADQGDVLVTYLPSDAAAADFVPKVARAVDGVRDLQCTMAETNILWIQEKYDPSKETYGHIVELARRWNAAVQMLRFVSWDGETPPPEQEEEESQAMPSPSREYNGGIEDDVPCEEPTEDGGLHQTHNNLAEDGVAGGVQVACCRANRLLDKIDTRVHYSLVVIGDVFLCKGHAAQVRMARELSGALGETLKVPVIGPEDLKKTYMFSKGLLVKLLMYLIATAGIFTGVWLYQAPIIELLHGTQTRQKILAAVVVAVLTPLFAYLWGTFTKNTLKLIRIE